WGLRDRPLCLTSPVSSASSRCRCKPSVRCRCCKADRYRCISLCRICRQQCLERGEVVAFDDEVVMQRRLLAQPSRFHWDELVEWNRQMVVLHENFSFELERRHKR